MNAEKVAVVCKALGDANRLEIVQMLSDGEKCGCKILERYQFLLFFDNLYDRFTDMEKKIFMKSFLEEGNIYEAEQEDGRILRSLKFRFPVFFNEQELYELDWDNESTVESVLLMRRAKR